MRGILHLLSSKNPPIMDFPVEIQFSHLPKLHESFLFCTDEIPVCNTSMVTKIEFSNLGNRIVTRNSVYLLS